MVSLTDKFSLNLPLRAILKPEGLLLEERSHEALFQLILPYILSSLTEEQLFKTCKVVTLAFKKSELEQEIMLAYWISLRRKY